LTFLSALVLIAFTGSLQAERTEFLYVSRSYAKGLLSFSVDDETGTLTALPSYLLAEGVGSLAYDHRNRVLYNGGSNGVGAYRVKEDGLLQALPGSPFKIPSGFLALDPFNRFLYVSSPYQVGNIGVYRIEHNGSLKAVHGSPFGSGNGQLTVDPFGRFLYTVNLGKVAAYRILETAALVEIGTPVSVLPAGQKGNVVKVDPTGGFLYALSEEGADVSTFRIGANGDLTSVAGSPTSPFDGPWYQNEAVDPSGNYLYPLQGNAEVDQILTNPNQYDGNILALHGIAGTVASESRTFTVLDSKSSKTGGSSARFVRVTFPEKSQMVMPAPGQEVVVVGKIVNKLGAIRSVALQVFTNPADIQKILAQDSKTRSPAKPSGDFPERNTQRPGGSG